MPFRYPSRVLGPLQQRCLQTAADLDGEVTSERVADAIGEDTPTGRRKVRRCLDGLERRGLIAIARRTVVGSIPGQGPRFKRADGSTGRRDQVALANVIVLTDAGHQALTGQSPAQLPRNRPPGDESSQVRGQIPLSQPEEQSP